MSNIIEQVKQAIKSDRMTQAAAAREIGIGKSVLSELLNNKYSGRTDDYLVTLQNWLNKRSVTDQITAELSQPAFINLKTTGHVTASLSMAHALQTITMIFGGPGVGKTFAAERYMAENPNVWLITVSKSQGTLTSVLALIAGQLNVNSSGLTAAQLSRLLRKRITGTRGLLIIDEAQYLSNAALQELRILCEREVGISLIGNGEIRTRMTANRTREEMSPVWSRVARAQYMDKVSSTDAEAYIRGWGVTHEDCVREAVKYCLCANGAMRTLNHIIRMALHFARSSGNELRPEHLHLAWAQIKTAQE